MQKSAAFAVCICACLLCLLGKYFIDQKNLAARRIAPPVTETSAEYESDSLRRFSLGFGMAISDLLWVRLLQNADHHQLLTPGVSWEFAQLNAITDLDRNNSHAYEFGSAFLSVFRRDKIGARRILEKWTTYYPTLWKAHYILGFHLYWEMQQYDVAAREMLRAAGLPNGPSWLHALGVRLMSEDGALLPALQIALNLYPSLSDLDGKSRLRGRIRSLRYHLQKKQWQDALAAYRGRRHAEPNSLSEVRPYLEMGREIAQIEAESADDEALRPLLDERFPFAYRPATKSIEGLLSQQDQFLETLGTFRKKDR